MFASAHHLEILGHLGAAWIAGSLIGLERSFRGRPAGFRTHALVSLASALLMLITAYPQDWLPAEMRGTGVSTILDPQRMAQGIMTGIGFLGAGVIFKEGLTVRGLTTAASIWITAAIGILAGIGFYFPLIVTTILTLGTLSMFRWIEAKVPGEFFAHLLLRCPRGAGMGEEEVRTLVLEHGFSVANMSYAAIVAPDCFEYQMVIKTRNEKQARSLADALRKSGKVLEFRMTPTGD